jgi:hypothetical protein
MVAMSRYPSLVSNEHGISRLSLSYRVIVPDKGTGINVYNVIRAQINISFTVDGGSSSSYIYAWNHSCVGGPAPQGCYNTSVYNVQSLTDTTHLLNMDIFTFQGTNLYSTIPFSDVFLDYAVVSSPPPESTTPSIKRSRYVHSTVLFVMAAC